MNCELCGCKTYNLTVCEACQREITREERRQRELDMAAEAAYYNVKPERK